MKTYSLFAKGKLTRSQCIIADAKIKTGMIESVYDDVISFHDLSMNDIQPAKEIMKQFGFEIEPNVYEEHYDGCLCNLVKTKI